MGVASAPGSPIPVRIDASLRRVVLHGDAPWGELPVTVEQWGGATNVRPSTLLYAARRSTSGCTR